MTMPGQAFSFTCCYRGVTLELPPTFSLTLMSDGILDLLPGDTLKDKEAALPEIVKAAGGRIE